MDDRKRREPDVPKGDDRTTALISLTREQKAKLQHRAVDEGISIAALVRRALAEYGVF